VWIRSISHLLHFRMTVILWAQERVGVFKESSVRLLPFPAHQQQNKLGARSIYNQCYTVLLVLVRSF